VSESQDMRSQHMRSQQEDRFLHHLNKTLDESEKSIDVTTQRQLKAARREAILNYGSSTKPQIRPQAKPQQWLRPAWWMPVGSLAAAATVAVLVVSLWSLPPGKVLDEDISAIEDIALLSDSEALEFYEELDFYLWLDDVQKAG